MLKLKCFSIFMYLNDIHSLKPARCQISGKIVMLCLIVC